MTVYFTTVMVFSTIGERQHLLWCVNDFTTDKNLYLRTAAFKERVYAVVMSDYQYLPTKPTGEPIMLVLNVNHMQKTNFNYEQFGQDLLRWSDPGQFLLYRKYEQWVYEPQVVVVSADGRV